VKSQGLRETRSAWISHLSLGQAWDC